MVSIIIDFFKRMKFPIAVIIIFAIFQFINIFNQGYLYSAISSFLGTLFVGIAVLILLYNYKYSKNKKKSLKDNIS